MIGDTRTCATEMCGRFAKAIVISRKRPVGSPIRLPDGDEMQCVDYLAICSVTHLRIELHAKRWKYQSVDRRKLKARARFVEDEVLQLLRGVDELPDRPGGSSSA